MRNSWFLRAVLVLVVPISAWAQAPQSNQALMANDHYTRSHDYDLVHQRIAVSHFDWTALSFEGTVTTTLIARRPALDSIILDEGALLRNTTVTDRSGAALVTTRAGDTVVVKPRRPLPFGDTLVFTIAYHGTIKNGDGLTFITNDGQEHRPDQIWSQGEDHNNHDWFPTYDFPNDKMTWELSATVPIADLAVSNGRLVSNVVSGATRTMTWSQESPSATYLVSLVVAPLAVVHDRWNGVPVDYYTYHEDSTRAWQLFHVTPDMIDTYSRLTGIRYPWAKYAQTTVADFFGGMENVSATTLVDWLPAARDYVDRPWYQYILIPHELAHQWFGDYVTTENWANMWLNEGFAEFMPGQYWGSKLGAHAEEDYYADEYRQFEQTEHQRSMPLASLGSNNIYPKGALVLEMLKEYLGAERFWASIHTYLTEHALGNATSDDLRQAVLTATGENLDWFWSEWVYGAGMPHITVSASYDSSRATVALAIKQTQVDSFHVDSTGRIFNTPQAFEMPVDIRVAFAGGEVTQRVQIAGREQQVVIRGVRSAPTMVLFDDGNRMVKELSFDQPVSWLANELRLDPDLWDRQWAIGQLGLHREDAGAVAALTQAATGSDYYLTRVQAVGALADVPGPAAAAAIAEASHDTSAAVRVAAIRAAGSAGGESVATLARSAFTHDASDQVRAAAVATLVHVDPGHAHDALATALGTPSYRDAIDDAALQGVAQTNDTSLIAAVDALSGHEETPVHVLAVLGARGNTHALDLVTAHLNDKRTAVRRWTVSAFENTMPRVNKAVALQRLQGALPTLTYADTRAQVVALIATLQK
ncbi:MAG TPA: M1 family aminopeptidase [Gemmatimonadales bacterium]|jgi:aminopeptidase N